MTWNYRVIKRTYPDGTEIYAIYEVYYVSKHRARDLVTVDPCWPQGETLEELEQDLEWYQEALEKPVLNYEDFLSGQKGEDILPKWSDHCDDICPYCGKHTGKYAQTYRFNMLLLDCPYCSQMLISGLDAGKQIFRWFELDEANGIKELKRAKI